MAVNAPSLSEDHYWFLRISEHDRLVLKHLYRLLERENEYRTHAVEVRRNGRTLELYERSLRPHPVKPPQ